MAFITFQTVVPAFCLLGFVGFVVSLVTGPPHKQVQADVAQLIELFEGNEFDLWSARDYLRYGEWGLAADHLVGCLLDADEEVVLTASQFRLFVCAYEGMRNREAWVDLLPSLDPEVANDALHPECLGWAAEWLRDAPEDPLRAPWLARVAAVLRDRGVNVEDAQCSNA